MARKHKQTLADQLSAPNPVLSRELQAEAMRQQQLLSAWTAQTLTTRAPYAGQPLASGMFIGPGSTNTWAPVYVPATTGIRVYTPCPPRVDPQLHQFRLGQAIARLKKALAAVP